MQFEGFAARVQRLGHGQQRRDADARAEQQRTPRRHHGEQVARQADADDAAFVHFVVHGDGAAARVGLALHAQHVAVALVRRVAQRVLAHQAIAQEDVHVRAGREGGQLRAIG